MLGSLADDVWPGIRNTIVDAANDCEIEKVAKAYTGHYGNIRPEEGRQGTWSQP